MLPTIIFIAAVFAVLYHIGVMQVIIRAFAWVMTRVMGASGAESLNVAASIFMGQTEAPLTIRPFLNKLTKSELMCVMTSGMAHISGGIMAAYIASGVEPKTFADGGDHDGAGDAADGEDAGAGNGRAADGGARGDAADGKGSEFSGSHFSRNVRTGCNLAMNVAAMLISFIALLALVNFLMGGAHNRLALHHFPWFPDSLRAIFWMDILPRSHG